MGHKKKFKRSIFDNIQLFDVTILQILVTQSSFLCGLCMSPQNKMNNETVVFDAMNF